MATKITGLPRTRAIVDSKGVLTQEAGAYFSVLTARAIITGVGSPEGVVEADKAAIYMDENGTSGAILYVKSSDGGNTGWVLV